MAEEHLYGKLTPSDVTKQLFLSFVGLEFHNMTDYLLYFYIIVSAHILQNDTLSFVPGMRANSVIDNGWRAFIWENRQKAWKKTFHCFWCKGPKRQNENTKALIDSAGKGKAVFQYKGKFTMSKCLRQIYKRNAQGQENEKKWKKYHPNCLSHLYFSHQDTS